MSDRDAPRIEWLTGDRVWFALRRVGLLILLLAVTPAIVRAAVTLVSFEAIAQPPVVRVTWATASEVDMAGFYVQRASPDVPSYRRISGIVPAVGDLVGASYVYTDTGVAPGRTYYYRLEAVEVGGASQVYGPVTVTLPSPATATPTPTPTPTGEPSRPPPPRPPTMTPTPATTATALATATPTPVPPTATRASPTSAAPSPTAGPTFPSSVLPSPTFAPAPAPTSTGVPSHPEATLAPAPTAAPTLVTAPTSTPTGTPASVSPVAGASPSPSPSALPAATVASSPGQRAGRQESSLSCLWPLALALAGCGLLLLGGWWFWWARRGR